MCATAAGWQPGDSKAIAQTLHVAALGGLISPGYARRDATLRRTAGVDSVELDGSTLDLPLALRDAAATGACPWASLDGPWFERRWAMGEEEATRAQSEALASALNAIVLPGLMPSDAMVQASVAAGARPLVVSSPGLVVATPDTTVQALVVAWIGAGLLNAMAAESLDPEDRRWMADQVACVVLRRTVGEAAFADWLPALMAHLVADFERPHAVEERVRRIARACLDQPPGEIERIALGLGRRQVSRLDRSVRRGFFVPPGFDLEHWLEGTLNAK